MDAEERIRFYLEDGWDGEGWSPYQKLVIGESVLASARTRRGHEHPDAADNAGEFRELMLDEARSRWMRGFYADPFTNTPKQRQ